MIFNDLTNKVFTRLTILSRAPNSKCGHARWVCECKCGAETVVRGASLKSGNTKSCGCFSAGQTKKRRTTHGRSKTTEHGIWRRMQNRCNNPEHNSYHNYGGRGIKVCERWQSFENFYADMGTKPGGMSLDRINNDGNYEPANCRWATVATQANNRRTNRFLTFNGETHTMALWAKKTRISQQTLWDRLRSGWSVSDALQKAVR